MSTPPSISANQLVAYNLTRARRLRGWTQTEAREALRRVGVEWSAVTYSAAERSIAGSRVREFDANILTALAEAFELPIVFFFAPPGVVKECGDVVPSIALGSDGSVIPAAQIMAVAVSHQLDTMAVDLENRARNMPTEDRKALMEQARVAGVAWALALTRFDFADMPFEAKERLAARLYDFQAPHGQEQER
jgi:transcriptional regulator with XRE-family HTH domain